MLVLRIRVGLGAYHGEEHFELCRCRERVGFVGGHDGDFALLQPEGFA